MANSQLKVGDVVELISGGPSMTVNEVLPDGRIDCVFWNVELNKIDTVRVKAQALNKKEN